MSALSPKRNKLLATALSALTLGAILVTSAPLTQAQTAPTTGNPAGTTGTASVHVYQPLTLSAFYNNTEIGFGTIVPTGTEGTVTVTPVLSGSSYIVSRTASNVDFYGAGGHVATYQVSGELGATVRIDHTNTATLSSGSNTMQLDVNTSLPSETMVLASGLYANVFALGGTLHVAADQAAGTYSGPYTISVRYQ